MNYPHDCGELNAPGLTLFVATATGIVVLFLLMKPISGFRFSFVNLFWASFIANVTMGLFSFLAGIALPNHLVAAIIISASISFFAVAITLQILARSVNQILPARRAYILSLILMLADVFVCSPIVALILGEF